MTIQYDGRDNLIKLAQENGWTIDFDEDDDVLKIIDDKNGNVYTHHRDGTFETDSLDATEANVDLLNVEAAVIGVDPDKGAEGIQAAADEIEAQGGGTLQLQESAVYDAPDLDFILELPSNITIEGNDAEIRGPGNGGDLLNDPDDMRDVLVTNKDWDNGNTNIKIRDLTVDGNFSTGERNGFSSLVYFVGCDYLGIKNLHTDSGYRHNFGLTKVTNSWVLNSTSARSNGDDPWTVSDGGVELGGTLGASVSRNIIFRDCWAYDFETIDSGFEIDDGPHHIYFENCVSLDDAPGFQVKVHPDDASPHHIYFDGCHSGGDLLVRTSDVPAGDPVRHIYLDDTYVGGNLTVAGAQTVRVRGGEIEKSAIANHLNGFDPDLRLTGTEFDGETPDSPVQHRAGTVVVESIEHTRAADSGGQRFVQSEPEEDGATLIVRDCEADITDQGQKGIELNPNGGTYGYVEIERNRVENAQNAISITGTASEFDGVGFIRNNVTENSAWNGIGFTADETPRQHLITFGNYIENTSGGFDPNFSPEEPANPGLAWMYLDDGTNTDSGNRGLRVYDGSAWADAWTL